MIKKLLFFLFTIFMSVNMIAGVSTLTFASKCNGSGIANDGVTWTVTSDATESNFDDVRGIHYGTNNASVTYLNLTTNGIDSTITSVVVNASDATGSATISVKVGTTDFVCTSSTTVGNNNPGLDYIFNGNASGAIVVCLDRGSAKKKALYVKSIVVTYGNTTPPTPEPDPEPVIDGPHTVFDFTLMGFENAESVDSVELGNDTISIILLKGEGSTTPAYYTTGTGVRTYGSNKIEVESDLVNIKKILFDFTQNNKDYTVNCGEYRQY